jgi:aldehyde dehydrogenase (NAD+)
METASIHDQLETLRGSFAGGRTRPFEWRKQQLERLRAMLLEREEVFFAALQADLRKARFEAWASETGFVGNEIEHALTNLRAWMKRERVPTPLVYQPGFSWIAREPLGVVLIIGPWNYPLQLVVGPLVGALAAGDCAVLKPSELAPRTSAAVAEWVPRYLDPECVAVVEGGIPETQALLAERFDHIFYTGGGAVGRVVMEAAAKHLTPVTLELGGKSPCVVAADADLDVAAHRIVWGKFFNAGQTCVAPDYLLVERSIEASLLERVRGAVRELYGEDPRRSPDYARIINERHYRRLVALLETGEVVLGGQTADEERYIAPTVIRGVEATAPVMADEIFGPILPVLAVADLEEAIAFVNARPKPLALYVFSENRAVARRVIDRTSSGGVCINDTIAHLAIPDLPFGGVGASGMGAYHGRAGFETFSHRRSVLEHSTTVDPAMRYPPYDERKLRWAKRLM